ncbi:MAG: hypothetical protein JXM71_09545 [Spirochaetales bacterium]|nr:hypothetical protein [Spirochaetales bacterium]
MKRYSAQSTDHPGSLALVLFATLAMATVAVSCVSAPTPEPVTEPAPTEAVAETEAVDAPPEAIAGREATPEPQAVRVTLDEPDAPEHTAPASSTTSGKPDLTVLSSVMATRFEPVALPEPVAPVPEKPAKTAAASPAKPPVASTPPATPKPAATPKPLATPKPAAPTPAPEPAASEPIAEATTEYTAPAVALPAAPASSARSVAAASKPPVAETRVETTRGERFELRFPGTGWIFLGDEEGREGLRYETRRYEGTQAIFALNPESPGEYLLRFHRQNPVDQSTDVSLVRVIVTEKAPVVLDAQQRATTGAASGEASGEATGPASPTLPSDAASPALPATTEATTPPAAAVSTAPVSTAPVSKAPVSMAAGLTDPAALIKLARDELDAKRVQAAIEVLDRYTALYPYGSDELFYLYGLSYEQDTPFRDVRKAYENYRRVRDEYPRSQRWKAAADRVAYLERHYFGLR